MRLSEWHYQPRHVNPRIQVVSFKKELIAQVGLDRIQLVTISRPSAFVEYEPYNFVKTEEEMKEQN